MIDAAFPAARFSRLVKALRQQPLKQSARTGHELIVLRIGGPVAAAGLVVMLTGCAGGNSVTPLPTKTVTAEVTPDSTPTGTQSPIPPMVDRGVAAIPACDEMLTVEQVRAQTSPQVEPMFDLTADRNRDWLPGPLANETYRGATDTINCGWGIPGSDGLMFVDVAVVPAESLEELTSALNQSAEYTATPQGDVSVFARYVEDGIGTAIAYAIKDDLWVIADGTMMSIESAATLAVEAAQMILEDAH
ncbi:hypothetical protein N3K63_11005 [Microbacterium sp. W1N]|uniref:hypothetical protein n=1 Tax=Microbacterium festucae TaxID=2977531 RepID=UPI0021BF71D6|nr:hypothetical protein [Microbacterium festucae]MCT9820812.1 hypothetical protein [Microbacterium festucae]